MNSVHRYLLRLSTSGRIGRRLSASDVIYKKRGKTVRLVALLKCHTCGKKFYLHPSRARRGQRFCSRACIHPKTIEQRWNDKVRKNSATGCWVWTGQRNNRGYGMIYVKGSLKLAHRVGWELKNGPIPKGKLGLHTCDNPGCVNPDHIYVGTHKENTQDMIRRGRSNYRGPIGERASRSKLKSKQVQKIRRLWKNGNHSFASLATKFPVSYQSIACIIRRKTWRHLK